MAQCNTRGDAIKALINMAERAKKKKYSEEAIRMLCTEFGMHGETKESVIERAKQALGEPRYAEEIKF
jgi:hypothetical protein